MQRATVRIAASSVSTVRASREPQKGFPNLASFRQVDAESEIAFSKKDENHSGVARHFKSLPSTSSGTPVLLISIAFSSQAGKCFPIETLAFSRDPESCANKVTIEAASCSTMSEFLRSCRPMLLILVRRGDQRAGWPSPSRIAACVVMERPPMA